MKRLILVFLPFFLFSCSDTVEITADQAVCLDLYSKMKEWYLWNDRIPEVNPLDYSKPGELMEAWPPRPEVPGPRRSAARRENTSAWRASSAVCVARNAMASR